MENSIKASLKQTEIVDILKSFGFHGLHLIKHDGNAYTYKFKDHDPDKLKTTLDAPTIAGGGKVAVYEIKTVAKLGVSVQNSVVRFIDQTKNTEGVSTHHLSKVVVPQALSKAYLQASVNPALQIAFCKKLWAYFNTDKFGGRLPVPKFQVSTKSPSSTHARGVYISGHNFGAGTLWIASFMFTAREPFFLEIFLHEMAHQAAWCISKSTDRSQKGHGPVWQRWMSEIGLDPRRFDPTDEYEYKSGASKLADEAQLTQVYGPRAAQTLLDTLVRVHPRSGHSALLYFRGRVFEGNLNGLKFEGINVVGNNNGQKALTWNFKDAKALKSAQFFQRK